MTRAKGSKQAKQTIREIHGVTIVTFGPNLRDFVAFDETLDYQLIHNFYASSVPEAMNYVKRYLAGEMNDDPRYRLLSGHANVYEQYEDDYGEPLTGIVLCDCERRLGTHYTLVNGKWTKGETSRELYDNGVEQRERQ